MASEVSTAGAHQDLRRRVAELERELGEAHQREAATAELLEVINRPQFALQSVFDAIAQRAGRLCEAEIAVVFQFDGELLSFAASYGLTPEGVAAWRKEARRPAGGESAIGRAILQRAIVQIPDVQADPAYGLPALAQLVTYRSIMAVPFLREGHPIGGIAVGRAHAGAFPERQIRLLKTFADQALIAIENTRLFEEVQQKNRALTESNSQLTEALEQQTATSEILRVISSSPTDNQPVLDAVAENAARLCEASDAQIYLIKGGSLILCASHGSIRPGRTQPVERGWVTGRAVVDRRTVHVHDLLAEADSEYPIAKASQRVIGHRTTLATPLLREGVPLGAILIRRMEVRPFSERQIRLLETFADQAAIAIENARLFEEVQAKNRDLTEANSQLSDALEQQTATSKILRVISGSPTDVQPVFETVVENAARLCEADRAHVYRFDGEFLRLIAFHNISSELREFLERNPIAPGLKSVSGRAALQRQTVQVPNLQADPEITYGGRDVEPIGTALSVPILKGDSLLGVIFIYRLEVRPFTSKQIALVETFADQAAIAISNVGLFEEVQARNTELRVALEQQTATSEILGVISRSPTDVQPIFDAIAESSVRLCGARYGNVVRLVGDVRHRVAHYGMSPQWVDMARQIFSRQLTRGLIGDAAMLDRTVIHVDDLQNDVRFPVSQQLARTMGFRATLCVPILRDSGPIGAIIVHRQESRRFTEAEIALLRTFADQAVIAIENARLFEEVQARNRDLTALSEVGRAVSSTLDLRVVLKTIVERAVELSGTDGGSIFYYREETGRFELGETTGLDADVVGRFRKLDIAAGQTGLGEAIAKREPLQVPDILGRPSNPLRDAAIEAGLRAALIVPLLSGDGPLGALVLQRRTSGKFATGVVNLMQSFADQSAIALENARLFEEIARKSRELEIASQHKSQFVANMSHELRTPLAAILGYAELMQEGFYGQQSDKSLDAITRIRSNGKHLLGLINTVLDIAKIESGQFTLNLAEYAIESVVETVRSATESLAQNKKLALKTDVAKSLPIGLGDEQRITQVLLNLVGNAIKFTDAGQVRVTAKAINGHFAVSVADTGPGIPEEHQSRIFEQFHQVDSSNTKAKGGTGLGLAIAKQIVEMHGGRIWVESILGKGSTFQMELPTRAEFRKREP
jgi:GAF domain-containing protein/anti-sigma regulatory factor (Ser/Thr protein kinase)